MFNEVLFENEFIMSDQSVRALIATSVPALAHLDVRSFAAGSDNRLYRLGENHLVRIPRRADAALQIEKECRWLERLGSKLPLTIPSIAHRGEPCCCIPHSWAVYDWIQGTPVAMTTDLDEEVSADRLAACLLELQAQDTDGGPTPGEHNFRRGGPLGERDTATRSAISQLPPHYDQPRAHRIWDAALQASSGLIRTGWIHGDLQPGNLLTEDRQIVALIDMGGLGVGDLACDLLPAWSVFGPAGSERFLKAMGPTTAELQRGMGWALTIASGALAFYGQRSGAMQAMAERILDSLLPRHMAS